jgi:hypothetical protein
MEPLASRAGDGLTRGARLTSSRPELPTHTRGNRLRRARANGTGDDPVARPSTSRAATAPEQPPSGRRALARRRPDPPPSPRRPPRSRLPGPVATGPRRRDQNRGDEHPVAPAGTGPDSERAGQRPAGQRGAHATERESIGLSHLGHLRDGALVWALFLLPDKRKSKRLDSARGTPRAPPTEIPACRAYRAARFALLPMCGPADDPDPPEATANGPPNPYRQRRNLA